MLNRELDFESSTLHPPVGSGATEPNENISRFGDPTFDDQCHESPYLRRPNLFSGQARKPAKDPKFAFP